MEYDSPYFVDTIFYLDNGKVTSKDESIIPFSKLEQKRFVTINDLNTCG